MSNINGIYVGGVNLITLASATQELSSSCGQCSKKITYFCMESCCSDNPLFCKDCESGHHFLHRTNDLKSLFIDKRCYATEQQLFQRFESFLTLLWQQKQSARLLMENSLRLYETCQKNLREAEALRYKFVANCWHDELYSTVQIYMRREVSIKEASATFQQLLRRMKLDVPEKVVLEGFARVAELSKLITSLVEKMSVDEAKTRMIALNDQQEKSVRSFVQKLALESFLRKGSGRNLLFLKDQHRSARMKRNEIGDHLTFDGNRLVIERSGEQEVPITWHSLPFLKELHTQVEFDVFPNVKELELCLRFPPNLNLLRKIPNSVEVLRIYLEYSKTPLTLTLSEVSKLVDVLLPITQIKELSLSFHNIDNENYLKLVKFAIRNNMRGLQVCLSEQRAPWKYNFARDLWQMYFDEEGLRSFAKVFQTMLAQISALERHRFLRTLDKAHKESIVRACTNELIDNILE